MSSTTRNLFANLPPPAECLAILIGTAEITLFGLAGFANPASFATGFGLPIQDSSSSQKNLEAGTPQSPDSAENTQRGLVLALAARNLEKGLTLLAFACYWRDRKAREAAFGHVIGLANCGLIGGALLYWSRDGAW
jgi:hypothetical protein